MQKKTQLGNMRVADIRNLLVAHAPTIKATATIQELLQKVIEDPRTRHVYVVDENNTLLGSVRMNAVVAYLFPLAGIHEQGIHIAEGSFGAFCAKQVKDLMRKDPFFMKEDALLADMAHVLLKEKINELPVVDDKKRIIGQVNVYEVIRAYLSETENKMTD